MESTPRVPATQKTQLPDDRLTLPGWGLPLDYTPHAMNQYGVKTRSLFPTVLDDRDIERGYIDQPVITLREKMMLQLINDFTDMDYWFEKVYDESFMQKWRKEMCKDREVTEKMMDWILIELRFKAKIAKSSGFVSVFTGDVVKTCANVFDDPNFAKDMCDAILKFEAGLTHNVEYRMATGPQEIDYVHPSFFPVVFGKTRALPDRIINRDNAVEFMGKGEIVPIPTDPGPSRKDLSWNIASRSDIMPRPYSSKFQWLPTDVYFRPDGTCYFDGYINNMHPQRQTHLYTYLEKLLDKVIPMFDMTLTPVKSTLHPRARIEMHDVQYEEISPGNTPPKPRESPHEDRYTYEDRLRCWRRKHFVAVPPEPGHFSTIGIPPSMMDELPVEEKNKHRLVDVMDLKKEYAKRGLQVIVRIDDNVPTPEDQQFEVAWHMEGQINEHICASALYYFSTENVETVKLNFRQVSDTQIFQDLAYERGDTVWLEQIYGMSHDGSTVQEVGGIECAQGRIVSWPNTLQHNTKIKSKDPSREGHVHAINFLLIDPNIRILSTANVPPQRLDWRHEADNIDVDVTRLSLEEKLKIFPREGDFPWALQEAREILVQNREERKKFNHYQDVAFNSKNVML